MKRIEHALDTMAAVSIVLLCILITANIVARELSLTALHRDADFSELGATSLAITRILVEIQQAFHVQLSPADVVDAMTVHALAAVIDERHASVDRAKSGSKNSILVPLRTEGSKAPLFVVAGAGVPAVITPPRG